MSEQPLRELVTLFSAGVGLLLFAGATWMSRGWPRAARLAVVAGITLGCAFGPLAFGNPALAGVPVAVLALFLAVVGTLASARFARGVQAGLGLVRRPAVRAGGLAVIGAAVAAGSVVRFEIEDAATIDRNMDALVRLNFKPPMRPSGVAAVTDAGRAVTAMTADAVRAGHEVTAAERQVLADSGFAERVLRVGPASDVCNCHGWVFTGGRFWVSGADVGQILNDNSYQPVSDPRPGDLAIYGDTHAIEHTAVVRAIGDGDAVLVEGKWGWMGVFLHRVGDSCYGKKFTFYRSPRAGHLLGGLSGSAPGVRLASR